MRKTLTGCHEPIGVVRQVLITADDSPIPAESPVALAVFQPLDFRLAELVFRLGRYPLRKGEDSRLMADGGMLVLVVLDDFVRILDGGGQTAADFLQTVEVPELVHPQRGALHVSQMRRNVARGAAAAEDHQSSAVLAAETVAGRPRNRWRLPVNARLPARARDVDKHRDELILHIPEEHAVDIVVFNP